MISDAGNETHIAASYFLVGPADLLTDWLDASYMLTDQGEQAFSSNREYFFLKGIKYCKKGANEKWTGHNASLELRNKKGGIFGNEDKPTTHAHTHDRA